MEKPKRKYERKSKDGKITIKHFVNERLLPFLGKEILQERLGIPLFQVDQQYPLYIHITVKGQHTSFKSRLNFYMKVEEIEHPSKELQEKLDQEKVLLEKIIDFLNPFERENFSVKEVIKIYEPNTTELNKQVSQILLKHLGERIVAIKKQMRLLQDISVIKHNQLLIKEINQEIFSSAPDIFSIYLAFKSLKQVNQEIGLYTSTTYGFNNIYSFLAYTTRKKYYLEDLLSGNLYDLLRTIIDEASIDNLKRDLSHLLRFK